MALPCQIRINIVVVAGWIRIVIAVQFVAKALIGTSTPIVANQFVAIVAAIT